MTPSQRDTVQALADVAEDAMLCLDPKGDEIWVRLDHALTKTRALLAQQQALTELVQSTEDMGGYAQPQEAQEPVAPVFRLTKTGPFTEWTPTAAAFDLPDGDYDLYTAAPAQPAQPPADGWVTVPKEPTPEMIAAAVGATLPDPHPNDFELCRSAARLILAQPGCPATATLEGIASAIATIVPAHRAMLAAAPQPPAREPLSEERRAAVSRLLADKGIYMSNEFVFSLIRAARGITGGKA